jgi:hypothetical protein
MVTPPYVSLSLFVSLNRVESNEKILNDPNQIHAPHHDKQTPDWDEKTFDGSSFCHVHSIYQSTINQEEQDGCEKTQP